MRCVRKSQMKWLNSTQKAHNLKTMSYQRRRDVMASHRRRYDVVLRHGPAGYIILVKGQEN